MRLPRILNQCHPIPGFVYGQASLTEDEQAVLIPVRPRKRSAAICSGCHQPAPGYDQSPTPRRFEFIGFWGYLVFLVYCMRRVNCKQCGVLVEEVPWGMGKHSSTKVHMHFLGHWARKPKFVTIRAENQLSPSESVQAMAESALHFRFS